MARERQPNEGPIEQVPRGNSPEPVDRRAFHRLHNPTQREGAVVTVPLEPAPPSSSDVAAAAAVLEQNAAKLEELTEASIDLATEYDHRITALEERLAGFRDDVAAPLEQRIAAAHEKLDNVLERLEALESLDAAAKEAGAHGKRSK